MAHIVIIGNGISGITCARHLRKAGSDTITVISSETEHFFARTALMYIYMGHMKYEHTKPYEDDFWKKNRIDLIKDSVEKIDVAGKILILKKGPQISYDKLVIACGSKSNMPDIPGKDLKGVQGLYSILDLENMEANTKGIQKAVIAGGGLIGIEMAEMLLSRNIHVILLVKDPYYWATALPKEEAELIGRHIKEHKIDVRVNVEIGEMIGDNNGKIKQVKTKTGELIDCEFVGLTIGVSANINFIKDSGIEADKGILVNEYFETSQPDIYAIGDCVQFKKAVAGRKPVEQVWYTGRMHGETLAKTLGGKRSAYNPAPWFNSAKFLDIEYQTYGDVPVKIKEEEKDFYWEHEKGKIALRVRYEKNSGVLKGINTFGMRLRHGVMEQWLLQKKGIEDVLVHFADANFDPEFFRTFEQEIINQYNAENKKQLKPLMRSWKRLLHILNHKDHVN